MIKCLATGLVPQDTFVDHLLCVRWYYGFSDKYGDRGSSNLKSKDALR